MESLLQVQNLVVEHAYIIGIGLLIMSVAAAIVWYWMTRGPAKNSVLENQARVNSVEMDIPPSATSPEPHEYSHDENEHMSQEVHE